MVPWIYAVNCFLFLTSIILCCYSFQSHAKNIFNSPAQVVTIRFSFIFILTSVSFFLQFLSTELSLPTSTEAIVHDMIEEIITGIVEAIMLFSFFFLLVIHVGGTDRAIELFTNYHQYRSRAATTLLSPELGTPVDDSKEANSHAQRGLRDYFRFRLVLYVFAIIRPLVSIFMVINRYYNNWEVRMVLATINILVTLAAVIALMITMQRLLPALDSRYCIIGKFFVVKGLLLVRSFQWAIYCLLIKDYDDIEMLRFYYTGCLMECFLFSVAFVVTFRPRTFRKVARFPIMSFTSVWDVTMHPVPPCYRSIHDITDEKGNLHVHV